MHAAAGCSEEEFADLQSKAFQHVFTSADAAEGPSVFAEKRTPRWSGR
ncbi:MAG: hypothetical protein ABR549_18300 [Mycobacteriales bacterium]